MKKAAVEVAIRAKALARTSVLGETIQQSTQPEKLKARLPSLKRVLNEDGAYLLREEDQVYHFKVPCQAIGRRETKFTTSPSISGMDGSKADTPTTTLRKICEKEMAKLIDAKSVLIYTDGSLAENGNAGVAARIELTPGRNEQRRTYEKQMTLDRRFGNAGAELIAIMIGLRNCIREVRRGMQFEKIIIFTDSKSSVEILSKWEKSNDPYVRDIADAALELEKGGKQIHIQWIPSHIGIAGNEAADKAAEKAANSPTHVNMPLRESDYKVWFEANIRKEWEENFKASGVGTWVATQQSRYKPSDPWWELESSAKQSLITMVRLEQFPNNSLFHREDEGKSKCKYCGQTAETVRHVVEQCESLEAKRRLMLGINFTVEQGAWGSAAELKKLGAYLTAIKADRRKFK